MGLKSSSKKTSRSEIKVLQDRVKSLEAELQMLHSLLDNTPDMVYFKNREGKFIWVNRSQASVLGLTNPEEARNRSDFEFFDRDHAKDAQKDEKKIVQSGIPLEGKLEVDELKGSRRYFFTTKLPILDRKGTIQGICGISQDFTARKRMEEALERERSLLRTLIDALPDLIYIKDNYCRYVINNKAHLKLLNVSAEDAVGKSSFDFFPRDLAEKYYADERKILESGKPLIGREEKVTGKKSGKIYWFSTTKMPIRDTDGNVIGLVCMSRNVTDKKAAEEILHRAKDELEVRVHERTAELKVTNEHLEGRLNQLNFLNLTSTTLARHTSREKLQKNILEAFTRRFPGAAAMLCEPIRKGWECTAFRGFRTQIPEQNSVQVLLKGVSSRKTRFVECINQWREQNQYQKVAESFPSRFTVLLRVPLIAEGRLLAVVLLFASKDLYDRFESERTVFHTLAVQAAVSLSNANYVGELGVKARLEGELEIAQGIQKRFTPHEKPDIPHLLVKGVYHPAFEVGGDYLDYFQTDAGHWVIVMADVSGKGIPAALVMTMLRSTVRAKARYETSAKRLMSAVNVAMLADLDERTFVTALCCIVDKDGSSMSYVRAGHPPMLMKQQGECERLKELKPGGIALGMVESKMFDEVLEEMQLELNPGCRFLIYTDGLLEARDPYRETYGMQRLIELYAKHLCNGPESTVEGILRDLHLFTRDSDYQDDLTILAMEVI